MVKSFTYSLLAMMLVVSILAPSIEALCKSNYDTVLAMDLNEEENNNKELEQKLDQNELFFSNYLEKVNLYFSEENTKSQTSLLPYSDFSAEIVVPPPERFI